MTKKQKKMLRRIIVSLVLLVAITLLLEFVALPWPFQLGLYLIPYLVIGWDILKKAALGIKNGQVFDENFLMTVATIGALCMQEYAEGAAVMLFYQIGELFQSYAVGKSRKSISALMDIRPDYANLLDESGKFEAVDPELVQVGQKILVQPGEKIPLDGLVLDGSGTLNTSALTGESLPRPVAKGDTVISGCINNEGVLTIQVTKPFAQSTVAKILDLVENSSVKKAKAEHFITKFARYYTPVVCYAALALAFIPSFITGDWAVWISRALTFLVISCPCALVISIPLTFFSGIGGASRCGILIKGGNYLEALAQTQTLVFDKTGTLTQGVFQVSHIEPAPGFTAEDVLNAAAAAESYSHHPIAKSLAKAASQSVSPASVQEVQEHAGKGVCALVGGKQVAAGNASLMESLGLTFRQTDAVGTVVYVAIGGVFAGWILISDTLKPTAKTALEQLKRQGIRTVMLTGDSQKVAQSVAQELPLDEYHAELLPADKVSWVEKLLAQKKPSSTLAFVGDGINDAPVLSRADVGIAMGAMGSDAAIEAADVVLMDDDPAKIALSLRIARKCRRLVFQNITFALGVKFIFLLLGALGLTNMWGAVFADVGVTVLAVLNASRMLRIKPLMR